MDARARAEAPDAMPTAPETETPRGTANALDAYERATRSGGNSNAAKAIVAGGGKKRAVKMDAREPSNGPPGVVLGAIPVALGVGGFAAFKALRGGTTTDDDDDDDDDEPVRPPPKKPSMPKFEAPKIVPPKIEAPKIEAPKIEVPKFEMPKIPGVGGGSLPPDAPRPGFPSRADSFAAAEEDDEEEDVAEEEDKEARKARRKAEQAEREAARAERRAEREAAKAERAAEREAAEAERAQAKEAKTREMERVERDRSAEEKDAAERKKREKALIEEERARIKAEKQRRADQQRAKREAEKAEREAARAARDAERQAEKEARAAERADRKAATALLKSKPTSAPEPKAPKDERSFTQLFAKKGTEGGELATKTQVMKKPEPLARTQLMSKGGKSSGVAELPANFPSVEDLEGLTKEEKIAIADEADAFAERLVSKAEAAEKFANGPVVGLFFFLKPGAIKSAERAAEVADLAEATAARVRSAAERGDGISGIVIGAIAATILVGGGAALLGGALLGGDDAPSEPKAVTIKSVAAKKASSPIFAAQSQEAPKLRDLDALDAVEKLNNGEGNALDLYEQMRR